MNKKLCVKWSFIIGIDSSVKYHLRIKNFPVIMLGKIFLKHLRLMYCLLVTVHIRSKLFYKKLERVGILGHF